MLACMERSLTEAWKITIVHIMCVIFYSYYCGSEYILFMAFFFSEFNAHLSWLAAKLQTANYATWKPKIRDNCSLRLGKISVNYNLKISPIIAMLS